MNYWLKILGFTLLAILKYSLSILKNSDPFFISHFIKFHSFYVSIIKGADETTTNAEAASETSTTTTSTTTTTTTTTITTTTTTATAEAVTSSEVDIYFLFLEFT